jgi:divalent metal cation (Fe/Co/Zn/Cd) transporter
MDISIDDKTKQNIITITHNYKEIKKIGDIISTPVGDKYLVFITISLDGNMTTFESHQLADKLENDVNKLDKIYKTVIHVEPI